MTPDIEAKIATDFYSVECEERSGPFSSWSMTNSGEENILGYLGASYSSRMAK